MHPLLGWEEPEDDGEDFGWLHLSGEELKTSGQYQLELCPRFSGAGMTLHWLSGGAWSSWHLTAVTDLVVVTADLCHHGKCHPSLYGKGLRRGSPLGAVISAGRRSGMHLTHSFAARGVSLPARALGISPGGCAPP